MNSSKSSGVITNLTHGLVTYFRSDEKQKVAVPSGLQTATFLLFLTLSVALSLVNYNAFQLGSYMDDASYVVLAKSFVFSDTYGLINGASQVDATRYPFGFPLILSVLVWLFPSRLELLKVISLLMTICNTGLIFWGWPYFSQNRSRWWGLIISILYAMSPLVIGHSRMVMSEPAFTTWTLITLILTEKFLTRDKLQLIPSLFTGVVLALTVFTRTIGLVLVVAVALRIYAMPCERSIKLQKFLSILLGGLILVTLVVAFTSVTWQSLVPAEYMHQLTHPQQWGQSRIEEAFLPRFVGAVLEYTQYHLRTAVFPLGGGGSELEFGRRIGIPNLPLLTGLMIGCLILLGSLAVFRKQGMFPTVLLFEILYFSVVLIWPWRDARFLYPLLPFLLYNFLWGIRIVSRQLSRLRFVSARTSILMTDLSLAILILGLLSVSTYKGISNRSNSLQYVRDLSVGTDWLKNNSRADSLVMAQQPQSVYLYSDRQTVDFPAADLCPSTSHFERMIREQNIDYILVAPEMAWNQDGRLAYDSFTTQTVLPIVNDLWEKDVLEVVYESESDMVVIYQMTHR